jgi:hypothetical protein
MVTEANLERFTLINAEVSMFFVVFRHIAFNHEFLLHFSSLDVNPTTSDLGTFGSTTPSKQRTLRPKEVL